MSDRYITVAEAAAILNVAIVVVQITYPLLITLVAVGVVKRRTNVATWSVFGRLINLSYFPFLLQTDAVAGTNVDRRIRGIALSSGLTTLLLAVAAIVTPLGLHSRVNAVEVSDVRFQYVKDTSAMGRATQSHQGYNSSRTCERGFITVPCPGNDDGLVYYENSTSYGLEPLPGREGASVTSWIPQNVTDIFTSAASYDQGTIASLFDIQYRTFVNYNNNETKPNDDEETEWLDFGKPRTQGRFKYYQQFLLENKTRAIEGLIVSTQQSPGIGFRNHTLPPASEYGYTWSEEILFLEPKTQCTNLNLTYEYIIPPPNGLYALNQTLVDRGGFVDLPDYIPTLDLNDTQSDPQFLNRSHAAAVTTNVFLARYMNLTKGSFRLGTGYTLQDFQNSESYSSINTSDYEPNRLYFSRFGYLNSQTNATDPSLPGPLNALKSEYKKLNVGDGESAAYIEPLFNGYAGGDPINISTIGAGGGLMLGIGVEIDVEGNPIPTSDASRPTPGSKWSQPLFACVSGVTASIKEVHFRLNGTATLENLIIDSVQPVTYSTNDDLPIWAMESTDRNISQIAPYWGLVSQKTTQTATNNISTLSRASFHLPAGSPAAPTLVYGPSFALSSINDAVAGSRAPFAALQDIFAAGVEGAISGAQDYTGLSNYLLYLQWQELLEDPGTTGRVVDLIWTDLMANALVGGNSPLDSASGGRRRNINRREELVPEFALRSASRNEPGLEYDWRYAIPALVFLAIYAGLAVWSLVMFFITRSLSIGIVKYMLNQTAAGRAITTERYYLRRTDDGGGGGGGEDVDVDNGVDFASTAVWTKVRGKEMVKVGKESCCIGGRENQQFDGGDDDGSNIAYHQQEEYARLEESPKPPEAHHARAP